MFVFWFTERQGKTIIYKPVCDDCVTEVEQEGGHVKRVTEEGYNYECYRCKRVAHVP